MEVINVKEINKGALVKSFDLKLENYGMTIRDCLLMNGKNGKWIKMPSRMYEKDGEKKYYDYVIWDKERKAKLDEEIIFHLEGKEL